MMIAGKVIKGAKRGRIIGFPTANIKYRGVANIGYATTFDQRWKLLEVYIFRFRKNIAGKKIDVEIVKKLRDEKKFGSVKELIKQIRKDVKKAKIILK